MKSKINTNKPVAELEAGVSPSPGLETATGQPGPADRKAEELYKSLFELSPTGIATIDLKGKITACNPVMLMMGGGYSKDEIVGQYFWKTPALRARDIARYLKMFKSLLAGKEVKPFESHYYHKDGSPGWAELRASQLKVGGKLLGAIITMKDITELKKAEEIKGSQERLKLLFEYAPDAYYLSDLKGNFIDGNIAAEEMLGYKREELIGKSFLKLKILPSGQILKAAKLLGKNALGIPTGPDEFTLNRKDGSQLTAEIRTFTMKIGGRNVVLGMARDISERKRVEEELKEYRNHLETQVKKRTQELEAVNKELRQDITKRKRVEEALTDSEGYLTCLLDSIGSGIMVIDPVDHRIVEANSYAAKMIGSSKDKIIGRKCHKFICPKDEGQCPVTDLGQTIDHSERLLVKANGEQLPVLKSVSGILRNGKSYLVESLVDITERKQVEEKLRHAAEEWRMTFDAINDLVSVHDRNYRFLRVNKAFARAFGMKPKEIIGKTCYEVVHGTSEPPSYCPNIAVLKTKKAATAEYYELKSGIYLQVTSWPVLNDKGEVAISIHVARDITERKKAEVAQQKSERNFRNSIDNSPLGVSIITRDGRLVYANRAFLNIYGYESVAELKSVPLSKRYTPESYKRRLERKEMAKRALSIPKSYEISIIRKDNEIRILQVTWDNVFWDGQPRVQVLYQDITERRKMQEQLIITDRLASVGELAAGVAHELNNPLTGVIGFSQLLLEKDIPEDIREDVDIIYHEAQRSAEVVKNLLTFARKHVPQKQLFSLNSVIEKVLRLRAYEQRVNNITIVNRLDPNLPEAMGDEFQLQQVFLNIILNAEFAMIEARHGGTLTITTEKVNGVVRASITDDGPGISKLALGHLFDPFFTTKEVGKGTGLGLSICHGIVNEHGGRIYAESPPGKGATFIVELPLPRKAKKSEEKGS